MQALHRPAVSKTDSNCASQQLNRLVQNGDSGVVQGFRTVSVDVQHSGLKEISPQKWIQGSVISIPMPNAFGSLHRDSRVVSMFSHRSSCRPLPAHRYHAAILIHLIVSVVKPVALPACDDHLLFSLQGGAIGGLFGGPYDYALSPLAIVAADRS